ncbi:helix-turn-helix domain-containing protein [Streptomyces sp. AV19]|uniref:helix-turn-helix domain-containing protein n=1 Tax=Streptomyces sp. AV19 TaxID=2793068 RepID=UPI001F28822D|nr:helix-turn-helix domain-containing protein [Streptomyces sp. AV19]MDG4533376.1 helix-turn-helix domain-containing protein [Streptomyces sp. AV19]
MTPITPRPLGFPRIRTVAGPPSVVVPASVLPPAAGTGDEVVVAVHARGLASFVQRGEVLACGPLDLVVLDAAVPFAFHEAEDFELHLLGVPRHVLGLDRLDVELLCRLHPHTRGTVAPLLGPLLRDLAATAPGRSPRSAEQLAACVVGLLGTLAAEAGLHDADALGTGDRHGLPPRLRAYVNERLGDRDLTPESIATHHHISTRSLHKAFAAEGTTVGRWIQRRRLEECRRELARPQPGRPRPAVAAVAKRWGIANPAYFSRAFRAAYGLTPTAWRDVRAEPEA